MRLVGWETVVCFVLAFLASWRLKSRVRMNRMNYPEPPHFKPKWLVGGRIRRQGIYWLPNAITTAARGAATPAKPKPTARIRNETTPRQE